MRRTTTQALRGPDDGPGRSPWPGSQLFGAAAANSGGLAEAIGFGIGGGLIGIIVLPIFCGIMGLIVGLISAALYNVVARLVGGIRIETSWREQVRGAGAQDALRRAAELGAGALL